jgi:STE24 endopeptidase
MAVVGLLAGFLVLVAVNIAAIRLVRTRAHGIEESSADTPDKVHRLQRLSLSVLGAMVAAMTLVGGGAGVAAAAMHKAHHSAGLVLAVGLPFVFILFAVSMRFMTSAIRTALARVRDVPRKAPGRRRRLVASLLVMLCYLAILAVGTALVPGRGTAHAIGMAAVYVVALLVLSAVIMPLVLVRILTVELSGERAARLRELADEVGVRVRGFRVLKSRAQKIANAAQFGIVPGFRYVLLTDYLLDNFDERETDAVVAHELGHARRHHILVKLGVVLAVWAVLETIGVLLGSSLKHGAGAFVAIPIFLAIPIGMVIGQGLVGIRLEQAADDLAAQVVGADALYSALEKLGKLNDTKRNTGRGWSIITQHPGLQARLDRLRSRSRTPAHT